jgi:hypothetical protein
VNSYVDGSGTFEKHYHEYECGPPTLVAEPELTIEVPSVTNPSFTWSDEDQAILNDLLDSYRLRVLPSTAEGDEPDPYAVMEDLEIDLRVRAIRGDEWAQRAWPRLSHEIMNHHTDMAAAILDMTITYLYADDGTCIGVKVVSDDPEDLKKLATLTSEKMFAHGMRVAEVMAREAGLPPNAIQFAEVQSAAVLMPNAEFAYIAREKLTDYLLKEDHAQGRGKAKFFIHFGYERDKPEVLEADLLKLAHTGAAVAQLTDWGAKFVIIGNIKTPIGRTVQVFTCWQIDEGEDYPRLITAYPV